MTRALTTPPSAETDLSRQLQRGPSASRMRKQNHILACAEEVFARDGLEGASLETIGAASGFSRHNLLYYYPSKEALYQAVLDSLMDDWLSHLTAFSKDGDPGLQIRGYIRAKFAFSRIRPHASQLFTKEMIAGAPFASAALRERIAPLLAADIAVFEYWADQGLIARIDFTQMMFSIWLVTQGHADHQAQFALLLGQPPQPPYTYEAAENMLVQMIATTLRIALPD